MGQVTQRRRPVVLPSASSLKRSGETVLSNAVIDYRTWLRACIVNFRTTRADVDALPEILARRGRGCFERLHH